jgi:hypothetical protein
MSETPYQRLQQLANWAATQTDRREVAINKEDLFWLLEEITKWEIVKDGDFDLADELAVDSDLIHDLKTESRSWHEEVME